MSATFSGHPNANSQIVAGESASDAVGAANAGDVQLGGSPTKPLGYDLRNMPGVQHYIGSSTAIGSAMVFAVFW